MMKNILDKTLPEVVESLKQDAISSALMCDSEVTEEYLPAAGLAALCFASPPGQGSQLARFDCAWPPPRRRAAASRATGLSSSQLIVAVGNCGLDQFLARLAQPRSAAHASTAPSKPVHPHVNVPRPRFVSERRIRSIPARSPAWDKRQRHPAALGATPGRVPTQWPSAAPPPAGSARGSPAHCGCAWNPPLDPAPY